MEGTLETELECLESLEREGLKSQPLQFSCFFSRRWAKRCFLRPASERAHCGAEVPRRASMPFSSTSHVGKNMNRIEAQ